MHNLNRRLFEVLIDEWRRGRDVTPELAVLGAKLAPLNDELLWRLARVPICWVDAEFLNETAWSVAALSARAGHPSRSHRCRAGGRSNSPGSRSR